MGVSSCDGFVVGERSLAKFALIGQGGGYRCLHQFQNLVIFAVFAPYGERYIQLNVKFGDVEHTMSVLPRAKIGMIGEGGGYRSFMV